LLIKNKFWIILTKSWEQKVVCNGLKITKKDL